MTYGCLFNNSLLLQLSGAGGAVRGAHPRLEGLLINQKDKIINQGWRSGGRWGPEPVVIHEGPTHQGLGESRLLSHLCEHGHQWAGLSGTGSVLCRERSPLGLDLSRLGPLSPHGISQPDTLWFPIRDLFHNLEKEKGRMTWLLPRNSLPHALEGLRTSLQPT